MFNDLTISKETLVKAALGAGTALVSTIVGLTVSDWQLHSKTGSLEKEVTESQDDIKHIRSRVDDIYRWMADGQEGSDD